MPDPGLDPLTESLRFAYADPPYVGRSALYDHPESARWDDPAEHVALMRELDAGYDGWALSLAAESLTAILPGAPSGAFVLAWHKPNGKPWGRTGLTAAWEPVIMSPLPRRPQWWTPTAFAVVPPVGYHVDASHVIGEKPRRFAHWLFAAARLTLADEFVDLFPGSGAMSKAWATYVPPNRATRGDPDELPFALGSS